MYSSCPLSFSAYVLPYVHAVQFLVYLYFNNSNSGHHNTVREREREVMRIIVIPANECVYCISFCTKMVLYTANNLIIYHE